MSVTVKEFGKLENGQTAKLYTMVNKNGTEASFTDLGAAWVTMIVPDRDGKMEDVVFGYDDAETYYNNPTSCGECVGRSANRIAKGHFVLDGKEYQLAKNNGENNLHSGPDKWAKKLFTGEVTDTKLGSSVTFRLLAPDGSQGYPGDLTFAVTYTLTDQDKQDIAGLVDIPVDDVQINGTSILQNGVANIPKAGSNTLGVVLTQTGYGITINSNGKISTDASTSAQIKTATDGYRPLTPNRQHESTFYGLAKAAGHDEKDSTLPVGTYTEEAKTAISDMLNAPVTVDGTTPVIDAKSGVRYVCGECSTIDISTPESGIVDVTFTSGSTPTILTVTPPEGMTMMWANNFDPTDLNANTTYEINIMDGCKGVACSWT